MKLEVKDIRKSFSGNEVLHGISFSVESGKALGLLGRNGAGKTTTIRILMDVFKSDSGEILINDKKFNPMDYQIGYLPEERGLYPKKKVAEQIIYLAKLRGMSSKEAKESTKTWLERLGISEYTNRTLDSLSKGNQQKVQLAQTLVCNPQIVILDEPFSGLDPVNSQVLKDTVRDLINQNKLVIFSSHQMSYVEEFCEEIAIINKGEIVLSGNLKNIKKEFGRNRLILSANNLSLDNLRVLLDEKFKDLVSVDEEKRDYLVLQLFDNVTKKELLEKLLKEDIDIAKFSMYEPDLEDIFVKKVGEE